MCFASVCKLQKNIKRVHSSRIFISHTLASFEFKGCVAFLWRSLAASRFTLIRWRFLHLNVTAAQHTHKRQKRGVVEIAFILFTSRAALARKWAGRRLILWLAARLLICRGSDWKVSELRALLYIWIDVGIYRISQCYASKRVFT